MKEDRLLYAKELSLKIFMSDLAYAWRVQWHVKERLLGLPKIRDGKCHSNSIVHKKTNNLYLIKKGQIQWMSAYSESHMIGMTNGFGGIAAFFYLRKIFLKNSLSNEKRQSVKTILALLFEMYLVYFLLQEKRCHG